MGGIGLWALKKKGRLLFTRRIRGQHFKRDDRLERLESVGREPEEEHGDDGGVNLPLDAPFEQTQKRRRVQSLDTMLEDESVFCCATKVVHLFISITLLGL